MTEQPFVLEKLPDEPILVITVYKDFSVKKHMADVVAELKRYFDGADEPLYYLNVAEDVKVTFGDMVSGLDMVTHGEMAVLRHPNLKKFVAVAENIVVQLAARALGQRQYGRLPFALFDSKDEALAAIRDEIRSGAGGGAGVG